MRSLRTLLLLVVLFIAADVVARMYAADRLGSTLASALSLQQEPEVSIGGFPFMLNVARGELTSITVNTDRVGAGAIRLSNVRATLRDVEFSPAAVLSGDLRRVRVGGGSGRARLSSGVLEDALGSLGPTATIGDIPAVSVSGTTLSLGPVDVPLPTLAEGMRYRSARVSDGGILLRFRFEPTTLGVR